MQVSTSGAYAGIGVEVAPARQGVSVVRRMSGSPAERAGIQHRRYHRAHRRYRGRSGATSTPRSRACAGPKAAPSAWRSAASAHRRCSSSRSSARQVHVAERRGRVADARTMAICASPASPTPRPTSSSRRWTASSARRSGRLKGLVIDLRNNPGGVLDAAVQIADDFLDHGTIVSADRPRERCQFPHGSQARGHHQRRAGWCCWSMAAQPPPPRSWPRPCTTISRAR